MERSPAVDKNWEALKRLLAMLVGMAELGDGVTLPRHLHRAILKLLRPTEAAARRLIIAAARGIVVTLPPFRPRKPKPRSVEPILRSLGIAVTMSNADFARAEAAKRAAAKRAARPRILNLSLLDPLKNPFRIRRRYVPAHAVPRIMSLDFSAPYRPLPAPPSPDDPIDAARLGQRLEALGRALDDLPRQAQRFARWKARHDAARARGREARAAAVAQGKQGGSTFRFRRVSPLRRGRPPGGRLSRYDPIATHPRNIREIDEILAHAHALAVYALETPDTS
ncbi:hypothetical protein RB623_01265 [Mesorhizobium sp. LHD-90]|uniref:hypothetical protein n=1 Tax=Mesorhizobium sp. LHD-90 TaxID=3071414 RepID=UPI0027DFD26D|nr:hypothetical protein [Mesorhizobium sp. LHD-90]MDQ6432680.1 hypothetical protein [Mesorhizobium sp. LHD-90]